jgi:Uma2 family endonuclease
MITQTASYYDIVAQLPTDTVVTFHHATWEGYEELLEQVGEAPSLRISYHDGTLTVMTISAEHENYSEFIKRLVDRISVHLRINIRFFGSATMKKKKPGKGLEPDGCFYVQTAAALGKRMQLDFETDPPPDIALEIDIRHDSLPKFSIYVALGIPEIWRYDGEQLTIYVLREGHYAPVVQSPALPLLTSEVLTQFLTLLREEGEFPSLLAFDQWLQTQPR